MTGELGNSDGLGAGEENPLISSDTRAVLMREVTYLLALACSIVYH